MNFTKAKRYWQALKRSKGGLALSKAGILNYAKHKVMPYSSYLGFSPVLLTLITTTKCNLNCPFCVQQKLSSNRQPQDMSAQFVSRLLDMQILKGLLGAGINGGEPLLNKELIGIIKEIKKRRLLCGMITNGTLLKNRVRELAKAGLEEIQLSVYDNTVEKLTDIIPDESKYIPVNASYVLLKSVLLKDPKRVEKIIKICADMGCNSLKFNICQPCGLDISETIFDDCRQYEEFIKEQKALNHKIDIFYPGAVKRKISGKKDKQCRMTWQSIIVDNEGYCSMCCDYMARDLKSSQTAPIFDEDSSKTYNSKVLVEIRKNMLSNDSNVYTSCKNCPMLCGKAFGSKI
ncbi:MAG: radical SAM protein [Endomicrobium sp.]|jgi:molybdenum cofactor biosynthesis enzyme MoaA|nr:radical SAM protein [Endomicrobium sp.]